MHKVPAAKTYGWTEPRFFQGDTVRFRNHRGSERVGEIQFVETRYGWTDGQARHVYYMRVAKPPDHRGIACFHLWIAEENILERMEAEA